MVSSVTQHYIRTSGPFTQPSFQDVTEDSKQTKNTGEGKKPSVIADSVTLSPAALTALASKTNPSAGYYSQFMPTREGFTATALGAAVTDPGAESFSEGKTLEQVAAAARASIDENYTKMEESGQPFDVNSPEGKDWYSLLGNLDRRALYAVSSNQGDQFTKQEQDMAQSIMSQQQGLAMGLYGGPSSQAGKFSDSFVGDNAARMKAGVQWLDKVSNDEKGSIPWAISRASAQVAYEWIKAGNGETPEDLDSENPLAKLIKEAMSTMKENFERGITKGTIQTADDLKEQPWFKGFEGQLDAVLPNPPSTK